MVQTRAGAWRHKLVVGVLFSTMVLAGVWQSPVAADVTEVTGSAYGHSANVTLFGAQQPPAGPAPIVTLPPGGSATPVTNSAATASVVYGPANLFTSGQLTVSTEGTTGPSGSVTSSADVQNINTSGQEVFTADGVSSTCTASEAGVSGSTTVTNGTVITNGGDPDVEGDETIFTVPTDPAPNTAVEGTLAPAVNDNFRYVFNEQIENPDGSITVNAVHLYLLGPTAVGDVIVGQSVCGITSDGSSGTTTTVDDGATTTTSGNGGGTTTTTAGNGGGTTTTTQPAPGPGGCERPTDFVGALIFDIFREISALLTNLGITGFEDFGCDDDEDSGFDNDFDFGFDGDFGDDDDEDDEDTDDEDTDDEDEDTGTGAGVSVS